MKCPVDKADMIVVEHHNIELDYCHKCTGVWFDCGELELLLEIKKSSEGSSCENVVKPEPANSSEARRKCPICGRKMNKVWLGGSPKVVIDSSIGDGWFDGGEMHQIIIQAKDKSSHGDVIDFLGEVFQADQKGK
jgi:Zn-finger nucleic acid-binding protein